MLDLQALKEAVIKGDAKTSLRTTEEALKAGIEPLTLLNEYLVPAMNEVGRRFECNDFFVPELLLAARAMKASLELIRPILAQRGTEPIGRAVVGTVKGDLHDVGKNLVASLLEGGGFEVFDLGVNVPPERFIAAVRENTAQIVGLSALLTTTMPSMKLTIDAFRAAGMRDRVKILVGGAPVTQRFADEIGADGYGENAPAAVALARKCLGSTVN
jgi:5-methyltetrahydrofolate--homocysteine methyltransferase